MRAELGVAVRRDLAVVTDEHLDWLSDRFRDFHVREHTGASFELYLRDPEHYEHLAVVFAAEFNARRRQVNGKTEAQERFPH